MVCGSVQALLAGFLIIVLWVLTLPVGMQFAFADDHTIEISTCEELQMIGSDSETYPVSGDYVLTQDINCGEGAPEGSDTRFWNANEAEWVDGIVGGTLIVDTLNGVVNNGYSGFDPVTLENGSFNGNGYTISNLWIFRKGESDVGLFRLADNSDVENVIISNAAVVGGNQTGVLAGRVEDGSELSNITINDSMARAYLSFHGGMLAGEMNDSSASDITITGGNVHGSGNIIGGIVGFLYGSTVTDSNTSADTDGGNRIGGAFGEVRDSQLTNIHVTGNVLGEDNDAGNKEAREVGGFAGQVENSTISNSSFTGTVTAEQASGGGYIENIGGFIGYVVGGVISNSFASNDGNLVVVAADGDWSNVSRVGGFIGELYYYDDGDIYAKAEISNVYAEGNVGVYAKGAVTNIGGLIGYAQEASISDAYAEVPVTVNSQNDYIERIGGFTGSAEDVSLEDAYATGEIFVSADDYVEYVGGFAGEMRYSQDNQRLHATGNILAVSLGDEVMRVGGFAGQLEEIIIHNSYATGNVSIEADDSSRNIGGFVGRTTWDGSYHTEIHNSYATGNVEGGHSVGGFVGTLRYGDIHNSYATGNVEGSEGQIGGFVGVMNWTSKTYNTYSRGNVIVTEPDAYSIGGYAGLIGGGDVFYSYSTGDVILLEEITSYDVGGFAGIKEEDSIYSSYSVGSIIHHQASIYVGGFIGYNDFNPGHYNSGYWTGSGPELAIDNQSEAIIAYPLADKNDFKNVSLGIYQYDEYVASQDTEYEGFWDFVDIWARNDDINDGYPYLQGSNPSDSEEEVEPQPQPQPQPATRRSSSGGSSVRMVTPVVTSPVLNTSAIETLIRNNRALFEAARAAGIELPKLVTDILDGAATPNTAGLTVRDLTVGMSGEDVRALQTLLMAQSYAIQAGATGYFANQTQSALAAYQAANSIVPAVGYFGPITRAQMKSAGLQGLWW